MVGRRQMGGRLGLGGGDPLDRAFRRIVTEQVINERGGIIFDDEQTAVPVGDKSLLNLVS